MNNLPARACHLSLLESMAYLDLPFPSLASFHPRITQSLLNCRSGYSENGIDHHLLSRHLRDFQDPREPSLYSNTAMGKIHKSCRRKLHWRDPVIADSTLMRRLVLSDAGPHSERQGNVQSHPCFGSRRE